MVSIGVRFAKSGPLLVSLGHLSAILSANSRFSPLNIPAKAETRVSWSCESVCRHLAARMRSQVLGDTPTKRRHFLARRIPGVGEVAHGFQSRRR